MRNGFLLLCAFIAAAGWVIPVPEGVSDKGWHLFTIFLAVIVGVVTKPLPMGALVIIGLTISLGTETMTTAEAFKGFSNEVVWLVMAAFFVARGFIKTGLGDRLAYRFISLLGSKSIGLGYGLVATDFLLSPMIPSITARAGGVVFPIAHSLSKAFGSHPEKPTARKIGSYLITVGFQSSCITSALFVTAMAGNPLILQLASDAAPKVGWGEWALASLVPGLVSLCIMPLFIHKIYPPEAKDTPELPLLARQKLAEMGKMNRSQIIMLITFITLLVLWIFGKQFGLLDVIVGLMGLSVLLITNILSWKDVLHESEAWDALIWFSGILSFSTELNKSGFTQWVSNLIVKEIQGMEWFYSFLILVLIYFYVHYFFASITAKIGAFYMSFLVAAIALGTPPLLAVLILAFFSSLSGGLTHYGSGPAAIFFGSGYVDVVTWWRNGFLLSIVNILIWAFVGGLWWKILGLW